MYLNSQLQKQSWVKMEDGMFHYQSNGKILCGYKGAYAVLEDSNPPHKLKCKECLRKMSDIASKGVVYAVVGQLSFPIGRHRRFTMGIEKEISFEALKQLLKPSKTKNGKNSNSNKH